MSSNQEFENGLKKLADTVQHASTDLGLIHAKLLQKLADLETENVSLKEANKTLKEEKAEATKQVAKLEATLARKNLLQRVCTKMDTSDLGEEAELEEAEVQENNQLFQLSAIFSNSIKSSLTASTLPP